MPPSSRLTVATGTARATDSASEGATPAPGATRRIIAWLAHHGRVLWRRRLGGGVRLQGLSERELRDLGVARAEIERIAAHRRLDRLRDEAARHWMR